MFQFRRFPSCTYGFSAWYTSFTCVDCSIRKSMDQCPLTAPHSLSQLVASFFGSQCQGIPLALFVAWPCVLLGSQKLISCRDLLFEIVDFAFWMFSHSSRFICFLFIQFSMYTELNLVGFNSLSSTSSNFLSPSFLSAASSTKWNLAEVRFASRYRTLVEMNGIEPMTPCLQSRCSPSWATPPYSLWILGYI